MSLRASRMDSESTLSESTVTDNSSYDSHKLKRFICPDCEKRFSSRFSRNRHYRKFHETGNESTSADDEMNNESANEDSVTDGEEESADSNVEEHEEHDDEVDMSTDNEDSVIDEEEDEEGNSDSDEDELYPFRDLIEEAFECHREDLHPTMSSERRDEVKRQISKSLRRIFVRYILNLEDKKRDPLFRAIIKKVKHLEEKGFAKDEAVHAAVSYWKHSINKLIPL